MPNIASTVKNCLGDQELETQQRNLQKTAYYWSLKNNDKLTPNNILLYT